MRVHAATHQHAHRGDAHHHTRRVGDLIRDHAQRRRASGATASEFVARLATHVADDASSAVLRRIVHGVELRHV